MKIQLEYKTPKGTAVKTKTPPYTNQRAEDVFESVVWGCFAEGMYIGDMMKIIEAAEQKMNINADVEEHL